MRFSLSVLYVLCGLMLAAAQYIANTSDANDHPLPQYSPGRPPAIPLAVKSPYTSFWLSTSNNATLNTEGPIFWPGDTVGWEGIVTVDGTSFEVFGIGSKSLPSLPNFTTAVPKSVSYDSSWSNFTLLAGPVNVYVCFLSPVLPKDICRTSIPLTYFTITAESNDGAAHDVQFYADINAEWNSYETNATVSWDIYQGNAPINETTNGTSPFFTWRYTLEEQYLFGEENQFPQWGNFTYSTSQGSASSFSFSGGFSANMRYRYVMDHVLNDIVDSQYRGSGSQEPSFGFSHNFGSTFSATALYTIGSAQQPAMRYLTPSGIVSLEPWWSECYGDLFQMIAFHYNDFTEAARLAYDFDEQLKSDIDAYYSANMAYVYSNATPPGSLPYSGNQSDYDYQGVDQFGQQYIFNSESGYGFLNPNNFSGIAVPDVQEAESYYAIVALAARQIVAAYVLTVPPPYNGYGNAVNQSEPLAFQKEISSDGNVNTVDVVFPAMSFFLYANPELLRYNLEPLFQNQEQGFYPNGYSMHDLGSNFPNATGHVEGDDEYMPVEECGNMLIMAYSYYKFSGNADWLAIHFEQLLRWTDYLIEFSLVPSLQLSTDDFAGLSANTTNLALKGIVGIECMAQIATLVGHSSNATNLSTISAEYMAFWLDHAIDPSGKHVMISYQWRSSWNLLYNAFPDKLLNLGIIPQWLYQMQSDWYPQVSQVFGIPLDNRVTYTKADWEMLTASICEPNTRRLFVNAIAYWLNNTATSYAFSDLYSVLSDGDYPEGNSGTPIYFIARPVLGSLFALVAMEKTGQNSLTGTSLQSTFPSNSTYAVPELPVPSPS